MQSKTSFFNMALFKKNISRTWIVGLLYFVLLLILMPISAVISLTDYDSSWYASSGYTKAMVLYEKISYAPTVAIGLFLAIIVVGITFWYMFNKRDNYMIHAFPVSRKSLYVTGIISSSVISLVPLLMSSAIMSLVAVVEKAYVFDAIWYWTLIVAVSTELFISIAMFSLMSSGQLITSVVFYFIFNFLYALMDLAFRITAAGLMFGMTSAVDTISFNMITPAIFIQSNCYITISPVTDANGILQSFSYSFGGAHYLLIYTLVAIVIFFIAYMLYKFKKLETVQDFIAIPFLKPIFTVGMSFFISMVAGTFVAQLIEAARAQTYNVRFAIAIVSAIIIGIIIFYATQMMIEKTIRVFNGRKLGFCVGYSIASLIMLLCLRFDVFNVEDKVPDGEDIAWVGIQSNYTMVFTDEDEINTATELHKNFLEDKKELRDVNIIYSGTSGSVVTFKYKLKNGKILIRNYSVVDVEAPEVSANYVAATEPILDFLNAPSRIKEHIIGNIWDDCVIPDMSFTSYEYDDSIEDFRSNYEDFEYMSDAEKRAKFANVYSAFLKDIDEGHIFTTTFDGYSYYGSDEDLYNDFSFTVQNKKVPYFSDEDTYYSNDYASDDSGIYWRNIYSQLNLECTHTLKALKDEGFYTDDSQIITYAEYNKALGYDY